MEKSQFKQDLAASLLQQWRTIKNDRQLWKDDHLKLIADTFLSMSCNLGNGEAAYEMASNYRRNRSRFLADEIKQQIAEKYFRDSAAAGFPLGMHEYGLCLVKGLGCPIDTEEGIDWLELAASQGVEAASRELKRLKRSKIMTKPFRLSSTVRRDPAVDAWLQQQTGELGKLARRWFKTMRSCGKDVTECLHDGQPTACVGDVAFGYVNVFKNHVNVGFFRGAEIPNPPGMLQGTGKLMRHVKLFAGEEVDADELQRLVETAYEISRRLWSVQASEK